MPSATGDGKNGACRIESADLHAPVPSTIGVGECGSPKTSGGTMCCTRLKVTGVIERTRTGEKNRSATGMESSMRNREGGNVKSLKMWICMAVDLYADCQAS